MSTTPNNRRLACEFMIAAAVCGAAYYFLVDSVNEKIAAVRHEIETAQQREASQAGIGGLIPNSADRVRAGVAYSERTPRPRMVEFVWNWRHFGPASSRTDAQRLAHAGIRAVP